MSKSLRVAIGLCVAALASFGQEEAEPPQSVRATSEKVEAELSAAQGSSDMDEETQEAIAQFLNEALAELEKETAFGKTEEALRRAREETPALLESIDEELSRPAEEVPPAYEEDADSTELELDLARAEADLESARERLAQFERESQPREERNTELPELLAATRLRLDEFREQESVSEIEDEAPALTGARRTLALARGQAVEAEIGALEEELLSFETAQRLLFRRKELAARNVAPLEKAVGEWQEIITRRRDLEATIAEVEASEMLSAAAEAGPEIRAYAEQLAEENSQFVESLSGSDGVLDLLNDAINDLEFTKSELARLETEANGARELVEAGGLGEAIGIVLRKRLADLPNTRTLGRRLERRRGLQAKAQIELIELRDRLLSMTNFQESIEEVLGNVETRLSPQSDFETRKLLMDLLEIKRQSAQDLEEQYGNYSTRLKELNDREQELIDKAENFRTYIDERVLWIRSGEPLYRLDLGNLSAATVWFFDGEEWRGVVDTYRQDSKNAPIIYGLAVILFAALFMGRMRLGRRLERVGEVAIRHRHASFGQTLEAFFYTILFSLPGACLFLFLGWRLFEAAESSDFGLSIGAGMLAIAAAFGSLQFLRQTLRPKGLGEAHFLWPAAGQEELSRALLMALFIVAPATFVIQALDWHGDEAWTESLGRVFFLVLSIALLFCAHLFLRPAKGMLWRLFPLPRATRPRTVYRRVYVFTVGLLGALIAAAATGYYYTALRIAWQMYFTLCMVIGLFIVFSLILRWLLLTQRRLALEQLRKRREAIRKKKTDQSSITSLAMEDDEIDLAKVDKQTYRLLRSLILFVAMFGLWQIWADELPALQILQSVELAETMKTVEVIYESPTGPETKTETLFVPITLANVGLALLIAIMTIAAARNLPGLVEIGLLRRSNLAGGERYAITTIMSYALYMAGFLLAFNAVGIGWSKVQWLIAAMSVGLGFGLQDIFANFVSGLIILFERPVRVGDTITVGGVSGVVAKIRIRSTIITDFGSREFIVPNKEFVVGKIVNWTLEDGILRLVVSVVAGADTSIAKVQALLARVAKENSTVVDEPRPEVLFLGLNNNRPRFDLRVYSPSLDSFNRLRHELHEAIVKGFKDEQLELLNCSAEISQEL